jgi:phage protein U
VDNGAMVNLMLYSLYKKLGGSDEELIKTKRMAKGVGENSISTKGFTLMKLTIGSKTLATIFFVAEVQESYNLILGREWIHGNRFVPSILHQFLIQWVNNEVVIVHVDSLAYTTANAHLLGGHDDMICLSGIDFAGFESLEEALFLFLKSRLMIDSISSCSVNYVWTGNCVGQPI